MLYIRCHLICLYVHVFVSQCGSREFPISFIYIYISLAFCANVVLTTVKSLNAVKGFFIYIYFFTTSRLASLPLIPNRTFSTFCSHARKCFRYANKRKHTKKKRTEKKNISRIHMKCIVWTLFFYSFWPTYNRFISMCFCSPLIFSVCLLHLSKRKISFNASILISSEYTQNVGFFVGFALHTHTHNTPYGAVCEHFAKRKYQFDTAIIVVHFLSISRHSLPLKLVYFWIPLNTHAHFRQHRITFSDTIECMGPGKHKHTHTQTIEIPYQRRRKKLYQYKCTKK